ncbi:MAG TPA: FtsQ-type POTRA domain-containing protein [Verrucomicrobiae bacterium]|jgi:cell division septal protein FtsQ|nr:FtsQ-type POTRA domain-containing protein [Verrucomicrobiae bacterium]
MWFRREQKNRRLRRGHLLDVKVRSDQVRATRTRLALILLMVPACTLLGLYLLWRTGEWALDKFVYENSTFAIASIEVQTDGVIAPEQLRRWTNVKLGANLIALDLASVKRNLELVPMIDEVSVERVLPRTLKVRVTEREPVAQVNVPMVGASGGIAVAILQLDMDGYVMKPLDPRQCVIPLSQMSAQLPVVTGLNVYQLQPGHRVESPQAQAALKLIGTFKHSPMAGLVDLRRVDVSSPGVVVATTGQGGEITFGLENLEQQLGRWRKIYDLGMSQNKMIASLDLAVANNVPVRWAEIVSVPVVPKNSNPIKSRRKNV